MQSAAAKNQLKFRRTVPSPVGQSPAERRINRRLKDIIELPHNFVTPMLVVCDPQGPNDRRLAGHLLKIEPRLVEAAAIHDDVGFSVANVDKSRQSAINKLGTAEGTGNKAMKAYWDLLERATGLVGAINGAVVGLNLMRVSSISDEGLAIVSGRDLPRDIASQFEKALRFVRRGMDLKSYAYTLRIPYGDREEFQLDLESFSRVLRHPEMIVSCRSSVSPPRIISPDERPGFIMDEVRQLENQENAFYELLPQTFKVKDGGIAEVMSPFGTSLAGEGLARMDSGVFVEVKLEATEEEAKALLRFTKDTAQWRGTKKGFMEIFSRQFGMRGFNTYLGKARTNSVLTPITQAMMDLQEGTGAKVMPINGGYLKFWVDMPDNGLTAQLIGNAIRDRMKRPDRCGPLYADLGFEPSLVMLDAKGLDIADARTSFILKSLGRDDCEPHVLDMTDFLLNFIENVHPAVQERIYSRLSQEGMGLSRAERRNIDALRQVCSIRRTIRDTEDLVWTLRRDSALPENLRSRAGELESWLFEFSEARVGRIFRMLAEEAHKAGKSKSGYGGLRDAA